MFAEIGGGSYGVQEWDKPSHTVTGKARANGFTAANIADPRLTEREGRHDFYQSAFARWVNHKAVFNSVPWPEYRHGQWKGINAI